MIKVKICSGTVCHVMGGSDLHMITEFLPDNLKNKVIVEGVPCLGFCNEPNGLKPPFVQVNNKLISQASLSKIIENIQSEL